MGLMTVNCGLPSRATARRMSRVALCLLATLLPFYVATARSPAAQDSGDQLRLVDTLCLPGRAAAANCSIQTAQAESNGARKNNSHVPVEQAITLIPLPPMPNHDYSLVTFVVLKDSKFALLVDSPKYSISVMLDGSNKIIRRADRKEYRDPMDRNRKFIGWQMYRSYDGYFADSARTVKTGNKTIDFHSDESVFNKADFVSWTCDDPAMGYFIQEEDGRREAKVLVAILPHPVSFPQIEGDRCLEIYIKTHQRTRMIVPTMMAVVDGDGSLYIAGESVLAMPFVIKYQRGVGIIGDNKKIFVLDKDVVDHIRNNAVEEISKLPQIGSVDENGLDARPSMAAAKIEADILDYIAKRSK